MIKLLIKFIIKIFNNNNYFNNDDNNYILKNYNFKTF